MQTVIEQREVMKGLAGRHTIHFTCPKCKYHNRLEAPASFMKKGMG